MSWRGAYGPWPGRGPFSHLPPWQRPGWLYGRGRCWWLFNQGFAPFYMHSRFPTEDEQLNLLEDYRKDIEIELDEINREIERLKKSDLKET